MKSYVIIHLIVFLSFLGSCQKNDEDSSIKILDSIEINGVEDSYFGTKVNQEIKFISENDTLIAKVLEMENTLCPSNPEIVCISEGYLKILMGITFKDENDTVLLKYGEHPSPDYWSFTDLSPDSAILNFYNARYILVLKKAEYYSPINPVEGKEGVYLDMELRKEAAK